MYNSKTNKDTDLELETRKMENELLKLKEVMESKRLNTQSTKQSRWSASSKKPLSMLDNKYVNEDGKSKNIVKNANANPNVIANVFNNPRIQESLNDSTLTQKKKVNLTKNNKD